MLSGALSKCKLKINVKKAKVMVVGNDSGMERLNIKIGGQDIERVLLLGVYSYEA